MLFAVSAYVHATDARITDTGYEIERSAGATQSVYWVDNHRLLFIGYRTADLDAAIAAEDSSKRNRQRRIFIWDVRRKTAEEYAKADAVCYSDGWVSYRIAVDRSAAMETVKEGVLGSEQETKKPFLSMGEVRSNFTCRRHTIERLVPPASRQRRIVVLREGDGYLDLGPSLGADPKKVEGEPRTVRLFEGKTGQPIQLPIRWEEDVAQYDVSYSAYRRAYVLRPKRPGDGSRQWPANLALRVYLLWSDGRLEKISVPYRPAGYLDKPHPTVIGWIFGGGNFYKTAGLYLFNGTTVSKLDEGLVNEISVSPDGCAAAVGIQNKHLEMGTPVNLRLFRLCPGGD